MKTFTSMVSWAVLLLIVGCAGKGILVPTRSSVELSRAEVVELVEAFKNVTDEKSVVLEKNGEANCVGARCLFSVKGLSLIYSDGAEKGSVSVPGKMTFSREAASSLFDMIQQARITAKPQIATGASGDVSCISKGCTLNFTLSEKGEVSADALLK